MEAAGEFAAMKILTIVTGSLLSASLVSAECVVVAPAIRSSSDRVRITALFAGKPVRGARLEFFFASEKKPRVVVPTGPQGIASTPRLAPGLYRVVATGSKNLAAELYLEVSKPSATRTTTFEMSLAPVPASVSPLEARLAIVEKAPIAQRIQQFTGLVLDPSGAAVSGAEIEVMRKGSKGGPVAKLRADETGRFSASLDEGIYVAFIQMPGFRTEIVGVELAQGAGTDDIRISMRIGSC
jgi:hypothetical protein